MPLNNFIQQVKKPFEEYVIADINSRNIPDQLKKSMIYSLSVGGKRLRPILLFSVLTSANKDIKNGYSTAQALEMIHTYSLIHDDLPAMDDDDLRRGQPTNHIVFGESTAILAGDSLLTLAFEIIAQDQELSQNKRLEIILELAKAAGPSGMVAGQILDMEAEIKSVSLDELKYIHMHKTGKLIEFAISAGAILSDLDAITTMKLKQYAKHIGLAFQIKDDLLDIEGATSLIGKKVGSDVENGKSTYVSLTSITDAKQLLDDEVGAALSILEDVGLENSLLNEIAVYIKSRNQ